MMMKTIMSWSTEEGLWIAEGAINIKHWLPFSPYKVDAVFVNGGWRGDDGGGDNDYDNISFVSSLLLFPVMSVCFFCVTSQSLPVFM